LLLLAFLAQYWRRLDWGVLSEWQTLTSYKLGTGILLATFVAAQWFLAVCRWQRWTHLARPVYRWHQRLGSLAALFLFAHSTALGFGYILVLSLVYLANAALGVASPQAFSAVKRYQTPWMAMHVALSLLLLVLMLYHAWTALYFE
jgi:hypothetical protein